jgi:hypothetical protein
MSHIQIQIWVDLEMGKIFTIGEVMRNPRGCTYIQGEMKEKKG